MFISLIITDGKVVLELSDCRENGKSCWVPVTIQKTYWPPPPPSCSGGAVRQESSGASFSNSDESSVQSQASPWLRETRFKNPHPKPSTQLPSSVQFVFFFDGKRDRCRCEWRLRRRPFSLPVCHVVCHPLRPEHALHKKKTTSAVRRPNVACITLQLVEKARRDSMVSPRKRLALRDGDLQTHNRSASPCNVIKKTKSVILPVQSKHSTTGATVEAAVVNKVYDTAKSWYVKE